MNRNLIGYRNMFGMTQTDLASKIGIAKSTYCEKERGQRDFTQSEIEKIMNILKEKKQNLTIEDVFLRC